MRDVPRPRSIGSPLQLAPRTFVLAGLGVLLAVAFVSALAIGAMPIAFGDVLKILFGQDADAQARAIVLSLRLPRAVLAIIVGAGLGLSGAALQGQIGRAHV